MLQHITNLILSRVLLAISGIIFWWVAARCYTVENIGLASGLISATSFIVFVAPLGVGSSLTRYLPKRKNKGELIASLFCIVAVNFLVLSLLLTVVVSFAIPDMQFLLKKLNFPIFMCLCVSMVFNQLSDCILIPLKKTKLLLYKNTFQYFSRIGLLLLFVFLDGFGIYVANSLSAFLAIVITIVFLLYDDFFKNKKFSVDFNVIKTMFSFSSVNFLNALSLSIPGMVFPVIVLAVFSKQEAGYFYIPWMMFSVYSSFVMAVLSIFVVESAHADKHEHLLSRVLVMVGGLVLAGCLVFINFGDLVLGIFNKEFSIHSFSVLKILFWSLVPFAVNQTYLSLKNIKQHVKEFGIISVLILLSLILYALMLMPRLGSEGIAYSWLLANVIGSFIVFMRLFKENYISRYYK